MKKEDTVKIITHLSLLFVLIGILACASSKNAHLEEAQFELDKNNYNKVISEASQVLAKNPGNIAASRILASAYFGRSGLDFFDLAEIILDLQDSSEDNFKLMADAMPASADLSDLRSAITTLEALTGVDEATITNESLADAVFDLGMMQAIASYALGVYGSNFHTSLDISGIESAAAETALADLISFDNRLIASGTAADSSFIREVRQTFCILEPISAGEGFTLAEYQALVGCQLSDDPDAFDTTAFTADIANCAALNPANIVGDCLSTDTSL